MSKLSNYMQIYLRYGFLFVVALLIWSVFIVKNIADSNILIRSIHELLSLNLMLWFLTFIIFMISLIVFPNIREKTIRRLANLQERDEREEYITGRAARASFIATISLTFVFLFFSTLNIYYAKLHQSSPDKPGHSAGVGFEYNFYNKSVITQHPAEGLTLLFDSNKYALSSSTLLLFLLGWQILIFKISARRLAK